MLQYLRKERGWTQATLAEKSNVNITSIQKLETSNNLLNCKASMLKSIADSMLVSMDYIIFEQIKLIIHDKEDVELLRHVTSEQIAIATLDIPNELLEYLRTYPEAKIKKAIEEQSIIDLHSKLCRKDCKYAVKRNGIIYCQKSCEYCMDTGCYEYWDSGSNELDLGTIV